jgi:hypothetical protein
MFPAPNLSLWINLQNTQAIDRWHAWEFGPKKYTLEDHVSVLLASFKPNPRNFMCLVLGLWLARSINSSPADLQLLNSNPSPRHQNTKRREPCLLLLESLLSSWHVCLFSKSYQESRMSASSRSVPRDCACLPLLKNARKAKNVLFFSKTPPPKLIAPSSSRNNTSSQTCPLLPKPSQNGHMFFSSQIRHKACEYPSDCAQINA